jgi:hypothetical protein
MYLAYRVYRKYSARASSQPLAIAALSRPPAIAPARRRIALDVAFIAAPLRVLCWRCAFCGGSAKNLARAASDRLMCGPVTSARDCAEVDTEPEPLKAERPEPFHFHRKLEAF